MNRKLFALLLTIPVIAFAADRLTASNMDDGGDKHKKRTEVTKPTTIDMDLENEPARMTPAEPETEDVPKVDAPKSNDGTLTADAKAIMASMDELHSAYIQDRNDELTRWLNEEDLGKDRVDWLEKHVEQILEKANPMEIHVERYYSRCPSGYHVEAQVTENGEVTDEGWMIGQDGCSDQAIGKFKYDIQAGTVQVYVGMTGKLTDLATYLRLYSQVQG